MTGMTNHEESLWADSLIRSHPAKPKALRVTLAYESMASALWAAEILGGIVRKAWAMPKLYLSPWCFGVLGDPTWADRVVSESLTADLIVLSTTSRDTQQLPPAIESWLEMCLRRQPGGKQLGVVAFFRSGDVQDGPDSPRIQKVMRLVQQAGCGFFAPFLPGAL